MGVLYCGGGGDGGEMDGVGDGGAVVVVLLYETVLIHTLRIIAWQHCSRCLCVHRDRIHDIKNFVTIAMCMPDVIQKGKDVSFRIKLMYCTSYTGVS